MAIYQPATEWVCDNWLNTSEPLSLKRYRGRPIVAAAFQMLCPGCVSQTIPQLNKVRQLFSERQVAVLGLHSVFEHHSAMGEASLRAFLHEYGVRFPVGIDRHESGNAAPVTMQLYALQGTPTLWLIDAQGRLRRQTFGHVSDLQLGAEIMALISQAERGLALDAEPQGAGSARCEVAAATPA